MIFSNTASEHDEHLKCTLKCLKDHGITLNDGKCQYKQRSLQFLGRILSDEGISPLPSTVEAIKNAPVPHDKTSLRSFMGLTNFYRNFIPDAASISPCLYDLLKENEQFVWSDKHQKEFEMLKSRLSECVPLAFYDSNVDTKTYLTTDASGHGISAYLSQVNDEKVERPVYFLSRKLSPNEKNYSVSEKEFLAVLWSIERLHQYLYGRPFTVRTDHQCLRQLLTNGVEGGSAPCRVIRWATKLLQYNFDVKYIPGKENKVADALSRVPVTSKDSSVELFAVSVHPKSDAPVTLTELRNETDSDDVMQSLKQYILSGWPNRVSKVPECIRPFWNIRNELSIVNDIVFRGERYVIPTSLQEKIICFAHEGHQGITKCKSRIREMYWWPNLNSSVETKLRHCNCCVETPRDTPVQVSNFIHEPWYQLAIDIKGPVYDTQHRPCYILVMIDCFSKYVTTKVSQNVNSAKIIEFLQNIFTVFGYCTKLTTDNGPQFISHDFREFLKSVGIVHIRSSLYNPQSNGVVERVNKNLKKLIDTTEFSNFSELQKVVDNYVLNYNTTVHSTTGKSPCDVMFSFSAKSKLNIVKCDSEYSTKTDQEFTARSQRRADYANERRRPSNSLPYKVNDYVFTKRGGIRKLVKQIGPFTFRLDNGFSINSRNILRRAKSEEIDDFNGYAFIPVNSSTHECPINIDNIPETVIPVTNSLPNVVHEDPSVTESHSPRRRSSRERRQPSYLKDYV